MIAEHAFKTIANRARIFPRIQDTGMEQMIFNTRKLRHLPHEAWVFMYPAGWAGPSCPVNYIHKLPYISDRPLHLYYNPGFNGVRPESSRYKEIF